MPTCAIRRVPGPAASPCCCDADPRPGTTGLTPSAGTGVACKRKDKGWAGAERGRWSVTLGFGQLPGRGVAPGPRGPWGALKGGTVVSGVCS